MRNIPEDFVTSAERLKTLTTTPLWLRLLEGVWLVAFVAALVFMEGIIEWLETLLLTPPPPVMVPTLWV